MFFNFLRAYINRQTLITLKNLLITLSTFFLKLLPPSSMASQSQLPQTPSKNPNQKSESEFDPLKPGNPISYPIKSIDDLVSRSYFESFHYPFNISSSKTTTSSMENRQRVLVCHDMAGGYGDDKWVQGGSNGDAYSIWHWYLIDVFVYFSHNLVTLPPPSWVNAAHKHGTKVLGTFITEWDEGKIACNQLLSTKEYAQTCAERLTELAVALGFDGWLINMEVELNETQIPNLIEFVSHLTQTMHSSKPGSLVIWYDSVTIHGDLNWQDQLNDLNKPFFDSCDGIFTNYTWRENYPMLSANAAGDRKFDVYMGIDVFGRNTYGGGQWNTNIALDVIKASDVSAAIFAPGWVYETNQPPDFQTAQNRWWSLIEDSWGIMKNYPKTVPFYSDFDQGRGHHFSVDGKQIFTNDWCNLSSQSRQPFLEFSDDPDDVHSIQATVDLNESSYSGGGNVTFKGSLGPNNAYVSKPLFQANLLLEDSPLQFSFSVKSNGVSQLGLSLKLHSIQSSNTISILLASHGNNPLLTMTIFSSAFTKVIMPSHQVTKPDSSSNGWVLHENTISMPGYTLTEIQAVCYILEPGVQRDFFAILGHLKIQNPGQNLTFPAPSDWILEAKSVSWDESSGQDKLVSLEIVWKLKDGSDAAKFEKYIVYVEHVVSGGTGRKKQEFLGTAHVQAFYVSGLVVPSGTLSLEFVVQVCAVDGSCQPLDCSPSLEIIVC